MMSNKMKVFVVEIIASEKGASLTSGVKHITEGNFLQEAYNIIGCNLVDYRSFEYKGTIYDVWFDDEFLLKSGPIYPTIILGDLKPNFFDLICGSFIIAKSNEDGETIGISTDEANMLILFMHENLHKLRRAIQMGLIGNKKLHKFTRMRCTANQSRIFYLYTFGLTLQAITSAFHPHMNSPPY